MTVGNAIDSRIEISVITPTWDRADFLPRVAASLMAQTRQTFEWVVADDGSTDDTEVVIGNLARGAPFPTTYLLANAHVGKARMDNAAVMQARGNMILWCDSDDHLAPDAIETLMQTWHSIPVGERDDYVGLIAMAATQGGVTVDPFPGVVTMDIPWNDLTERHNMQVDMVYLIRSDILRQNPFPEIDLVIPESVIWSRIGNMRARYIAHVVKLIEYRTPKAISFSGVMAYNRGRALALALTERQLRRYPRSFRTQCWKLVTYIRYSILGEVSIGQARKIWAENRGGRLFWLAVCIGFLLALRDTWRGNVVKSHREFDQNRHASIEVRYLV